VSLKSIRIATRKSPLALWQAEYVASRIKQVHTSLTTELVRMTTLGDKILDAPLAKVGGKGLFVKELEQGMLNRKADIAVHSMKDVPVEFPPGLHLGAILKRHDPRDAFISNKYQTFAELPIGARIGTSSLRRECQIRAHGKRLQIAGLRGNVNTRLSKLDSGEFDAIVLASAGLQRLGLAFRINEHLETTFCLPAIGQGAIGVECRSDDPWINEVLADLNDEVSAICVTAERAMNRTLQGGCQVPIAGHAVLSNETINLRGLVGKPNGSLIIRGEVSGAPANAAEIGHQLGQDLLNKGANEILRDLY